MSIYNKISKKMFKEIQYAEDQRVMKILEEMKCEYCGQMLSSKREDIDACCEKSMIEYIVEM